MDNDGKFKVITTITAKELTAEQLTQILFGKNVKDLVKDMRTNADHPLMHSQ